MDRAIADFVAHLVPEAFAISSSAYRTELIERTVDGAGLARWVTQCRGDAVAAAYPFGGWPSGIVFVQSGDARWRWDQEPCEELEWMTGRINDEIAGLRDPWVFVCSLRSRDHAAEAAGGAPSHPGQVTWRVPWYAEARSRGVARVLSGIDEVVGDKVNSTSPMGDAPHFVRGAKRVLRGHPSRRAYRFR
jgi:hypothetical protein